MKYPWGIRDEAEIESYAYFDKNVRPLPKDTSGKIDPSQGGLHDNDVDAFRHAYVSGVFTQVYSETTADIFGRMNESFNPASVYSNSTNPGSGNMDLWNNSVGRKYGLKAKDRTTLLKMIHGALKNGELILTSKDKRQYEGATHNPVNKSKPVIVLQESKDGRNEIFFDVEKRKLLTVNEFILQIEAGQYPGYTVKQINGLPTPVSNPDSRGTNNLG